MSPRNTKQMRAIERAIHSLVSRILGEKPSSMSMSVARAESGNQQVLVNWEAAGWTGVLTLTRPGIRELSGKELGGVLTVLEALDAEESDT